MVVLAKQGCSEYDARECPAAKRHILVLLWRRFSRIIMGFFPATGDIAQKLGGNERDDLVDPSTHEMGYLASDIVSWCYQETGNRKTAGHKSGVDYLVV